MFKSLTGKYRIINRIIIFNDSISRFYQCSIWGFFQRISMFLPQQKRIAEVIKFLEILKRYVSENKIYFCSRKKSNILLNKKVIFVFHTILKFEFITQIICCIIHRCLCSRFISRFISVYKKWNIETMLTFPYSNNWQKFERKWMKKEARSIRVWTLNMYLGKLIVVFWSFFWDDLLFDFCTVSKILICFSLRCVYSTTTKDILAIYNCRYCIECLLYKFFYHK